MTSSLTGSNTTSTGMPQWIFSGSGSHSTKRVNIRTPSSSSTTAVT
ncbi:MAG: hypothetical protein V3S00_03215 [Dehalococcoidia bacterium]